MRTLIPADTLVYLETNDLAAALQPIVDSKPFTEVAKSKPDFSALKGVQLAVAAVDAVEERLDNLPTGEGPGSQCREHGRSGGEGIQGHRGRQASATLRRTRAAAVLTRT